MSWRPLTAALAAVLVLATGCSDATPEDAAPTDGQSGGVVTTAQAETLAVARFNNYRRHFVPLEVTMELDGQAITLTGMVDFRAGRASAGFVTGDSPPNRGLLQWNQTHVALLADADPAGYLRGPAQGWDVRPLGDTQPLDRVLRVVLALSADRPDNPLLLRQGGVRLLGTETVLGVETTIMSGPDEAKTGTPSSIRYWVDDTGHLLQVEVNVPGATKLTVIRLPPGSGEKFAVNSGLRRRTG